MRTRVNPVSVPTTTGKAAGLGWLAANISEQRLVLAAVAVVSASGLVFEIALTRIFSFFFQYHFAFLAVSLAVFGLSIGAALVQVKRLKSSTLTAILLPLALSYSSVALLLAFLPSAESIWPRALVALIPFVLTGLFAALAFGRFNQQSGTLYAADLVGAPLACCWCSGCSTSSARLTFCYC